MSRRRIIARSSHRSLSYSPRSRPRNYGTRVALIEYGEKHTRSVLLAVISRSGARKWSEREGQERRIAVKRVGC